ncbi:MAG: UDP-N-acetylglucosamine 1-carboxyvinyltransferase [Patescibacteria group bacterium]|nr:UDP-N-acetylglucosamine 1-carboxyvinyltransferase [Patescibacteria group bacterium]MCL5224017.1 UDP-N-acetylglucosamine 1-carboxyvinyltransferase [Patescibacteria group bacterium]
MKFVVNGGKELNGEIEVRGSKNAATPIIASTLLTSRPCIVENIPLISDVFTTLQILESMGSEISWLGERKVRIINRDIDPTRVDQRLVRKIRSSILILGPLLARYGEVVIATPGGCQIGTRSISAHLEAIKDLGGVVAYDPKEDLYEITKPVGQWGNGVVLKEFSVTATENIMMLGALSAPLKIELCAAEPHVQELGYFMNILGADYRGLGTHEIVITRGIENRNQEISHRIASDYLEAGTFMALAAMIGDKVRIKNVPIDYLTAAIQKLREFGVLLSISGDSILITGDRKRLTSTNVQTLPYPGFPTDLQAQFGAMATQCQGDSLIFDTLYEGRLKYIEELVKMGARAKILDPHRALISGPTKLHGAEIESLDLRAGATLVIAALAASGVSSLGGIEQIDRGYEHIEERLKLLGAEIERNN